MPRRQGAPPRLPPGSQAAEEGALIVPDSAEDVATGCPVEIRQQSAARRRAVCAAPRQMRRTCDGRGARSLPSQLRLRALICDIPGLTSRLCSAVRSAGCGLGDTGAETLRRLEAALPHGEQN